jgi:hypothetical protein
MMDEENINKQVKEAEWKGYMVKAVEDLSNELDESKDTLKSCSRDILDKIDRVNEKIDKVNMRITNLEIKVASIGAISAIVASIVLHVGIPGL